MIDFISFLPQFTVRQLLDFSFNDKGIQIMPFLFIHHDAMPHRFIATFLKVGPTL